MFFFKSWKLLEDTTKRKMSSVNPASSCAGSEAPAQPAGRDERRARVLPHPHALRQEVSIAVEAAELEVGVEITLQDLLSIIVNAPNLTESERENQSAEFTPSKVTFAK